MSTGKHLGDTDKLWKTRSKETTKGRGSSGINFPSYYPYMYKTHIAAQSQGLGLNKQKQKKKPKTQKKQKAKPNKTDDLWVTHMKIRSLQAAKIKMKLICF